VTYCELVYYILNEILSLGIDSGFNYWAIAVCVAYFILMEDAESGTERFCFAFNQRETIDNVHYVSVKNYCSLRDARFPPRCR
jgi:hypothetical protein